MKRGPSKGYIKELEDRLNSLESSFGVDGLPSTRRNSAVSVDPRAALDSSAPSSANLSSGHKTSISSTGSNTYPADSPNSQYSGSYAYAYQALGSPRTVIGDQPRPRADSAHSIHSLAASSGIHQPALLNSPTINQSVPGQRKRAFSSTMDYTNERVRQQQPSPMAPIRQPSLGSALSNNNIGNLGNVQQHERLPSIDSFRSNPSMNQLPPLQPPSCITDDSNSQYMAPPNGPGHFWKPSYGGNRLPAHRPSEIENGPRSPQPPSGFARQQPIAPPLQQLQPPSTRQLHRHSIGTGMMGVYDPVTSSASHTPTDALSRRGSIESFPFNWDEEVIDAYYSYIHPTLPILAQSRAKLRAGLVNAPSPVRNACLYALYALIRGMIFRKRSDQDIHYAFQHLSEAVNIGKLSFASSLLMVQTMTILALETTNHGPAALEGNMRSVSYWLGSAIGLSYSLRLNMLKASAYKADENDLDSDTRSGRRVFAALYVLDRWISVALSQPMMIADDSFVPKSDDLITLTPESYHLLRFSTVLGHVIGSCSHFEDDASPDARHHHIATLLRGELERVRESVDDLWETKPVLEVTYWHIRLLMLRLLQHPDPQVLLGPAVRMIGLLVPHLQQQSQPQLQPQQNGSQSTSRQCMVPLGHHFLVLATETLLDLTDISETCEEAWRLLNALLDSLNVSHSDSGNSYLSLDSPWEVCVRKAIESKKSRTARNSISGVSTGTSTGVIVSGGKSAPGAVTSQSGTPGGDATSAAVSSGLERLASIAVGESTSSGSRNLLTVETARLRNVGYLNVLGIMM